MGDHAELMAATSLCTDPASPAYESRTCQSYRDGNEAVADFGDFFQSIGLAMPRPVTTCRADPSLCAAELADVWAETAEAAEVFRRAYALDNGESDAIRDNLRLALAKIENPGYDPDQQQDYALVRLGSGSYLIRRTF